MKNKILTRLIPALAAIFLLSSCATTKYAQVIQGKWKMDTHLNNGIDDTEEFRNTYDSYGFEFENTGAYKEFFSMVGLINTTLGEWKIQNKDELLLRDLITPDNSRTFKILELSKSRLRLKLKDVEFRMHPLADGEKMFR